MEENPALRSSAHKVSARRSAVKAVSWRAIGTFNTPEPSRRVIIYIGPLFEHAGDNGDALQAASYIAIPEIVTRMTLYFLDERS
jgi:hypothetical protein